MRRSPFRTAAVTLAVTALAAGVAVLTRTTAGATGGSLAITPTSGSNTVSPTLATDAPCPDGSTSIFAKITGGNAGSQFPADGTIVLTPQPGTAFSTTEAFSIQTSYSFQDAAADAGFATLAGSYTIVLTCQTDLGEELATFTSYPVVFAIATAYSVDLPLPAPTWRPLVYGTVGIGYRPLCLAAFANATTVAYQWLKNGTAIAGATASSYLVPESAYGAQLSCRVTASNDDNDPVAATSAARTVGVGPALRATTLPYLYGAVRVGSRVYCKPGAWTPAATSYAYGWRLDGRTISGTASSVVPPSSWRGHVLACTVSARRLHWTTGKAVSRGVRIA